MANDLDRQQIDWESVLNSLEWDDQDRQQEALRQRLRERARQYAVPVKEDQITGDTYNVLTFALGSEMYGVEVMVVRGVRTLNRITRVPGAPRFYQGVVNVRGQIISVLDLRQFFGLSPGGEAPPASELIIARANRLEIALLANHVEGVLTIPRTALEPIEEMRYALGVTKERLVVLDIEQLLTDERLIIGGIDE